MRKICIFVIFVLIFISREVAGASLKLDFESGPVFITKNDVKLPNDTGTKFSLTQDLKTDASMYFRGRLIYVIGKRHNLSFLAAPLRVGPKGSINSDISFNGEIFPAGTQINARYRFDSYRWTYRYDIVSNQKLIFGMGLTAKIRSAEISLSGAGRYSKYDNVGFVPLIHLKFLWRFFKPLAFTIEGDAMGVPQGRAEDFLFGIVYEPLEKFALRLGYRFLEGGADVADVYNFAFISYIAFGATMSF